MNKNPDPLNIDNHDVNRHSAIEVINIWYSFITGNKSYAITCNLNFNVTWIYIFDNFKSIRSISWYFIYSIYENFSYEFIGFEK